MSKLSCTNVIYQIVIDGTIIKTFFENRFYNCTHIITLNRVVNISSMVIQIAIEKG